MIRSDKGECKACLFRGLRLMPKLNGNETDGHWSRLSATLRCDLQGGGRFFEALPNATNVIPQGQSAQCSSNERSSEYLSLRISCGFLMGEDLPTAPDLSGKERIISYWPQLQCQSIFSPEHFGQINVRSKRRHLFFSCSKCLRVGPHLTRSNPPAFLFQSCLVQSLCRKIWPD